LDIAPPTQPTPPHTQGRWTIVGLLLVVQIFANIDRQVLNVLVEPVQAEFGLSNTVMGLLTGAAFSVFYAVLGVPLAMLADRANRRNMIAAAIAVWSGMTVLCGMAANAAQLILARIGVAVGEAGAGPASHSIVSDLFAPKERATPMAVLAMGPNFGILFGFILGGLISAAFGWRAAFIAVGVPGLLVALIVVLGMREPKRGMADDILVDTDAPALGLGELMRTIAAKPSLLFIIMGFSCAGMFGYGTIAWITPFFHRSYGLSEGEIGPLIGLIVGIAGAVGTFAGGFLADRLGKRDVRWRLWIICIVGLGSMPLAVGAYLAQNQWLTLALMVLPASIAVFHAGPSFALLQGLVHVRLRAVGAAFLLFCLNVVGGGLGPLYVGIMTDLLEPSQGVEALRYALLSLSIPMLFSALFYFLATRTLVRDLAAPHPVS
jgi:predicted MFS family arabinose efflux permease